MWNSQLGQLIIGLPDFSSQGLISVRCVYDEWYWEQIDSKNTTYFEQNEYGFYLLKDGDGENDLNGTVDSEDNINYRKQFFWGDMPR